MRIALDAMGGDTAPAPIVAGAVQAVASRPDLTVVLVGDQTRIEAELARLGGASDRIEIVHASQTIDMGDSPVEALRKKPDNSIARSWRLMAERQVDAVVGAGSTGAMVAAGLMTKRFLKHVRRPGIAAVMPTAKGPCVVLDVGANITPKPLHLYQYGVMGGIFAKLLLKKDHPTIGLINVGEEEAKGHDLAKETFSLFQNSPWKDQFKGNVEGRDIHRGAVDVVVTDGFVGNVVLKLSEGVLEFVVKLINQEVLGELTTERDKAGLALKAMLGKYHYSAFGGAPLLGVDGICIICHGSSDERAIRNALNVATQYNQTGLNDRIIQELASFPAGAGE